jgi:hypothetical protein
MLGPPRGVYSTKQCNTPGDQTFIAVAFDTRYHIEEDNTITGSASSSVHSFSLFNGQLAVNTGTRQENDQYSYSQRSNGPQNAPRNIYEVCTGPWGNGNWTILSADPAVPLYPTITSSLTAQSQINLDANVSVFITPNLQMPYSQIERDTSTGNNNRLQIKQSTQPFAIYYNPTLQSYSWREIIANYRDDQANPSTNIPNTVDNNLFVKSELINNGVERRFLSFPYLFRGTTLNVESNKFVTYSAALYDNNYNYSENFDEDLEINVYKPEEQLNSQTGLFELNTSTTDPLKKIMLAMPLPDGWQRRDTIAVSYFPS